MTTEKFDELWRNPAHWSGHFYRCPEDPRLVVPKRSGYGWTVNMGHPKGKVSLALLVICGLISPVYVVVTEGPTINPMHILAAIGISCGMTLAFCLFFSRTRR